MADYKFYSKDEALQAVGITLTQEQTDAFEKVSYFNRSDTPENVTGTPTNADLRTCGRLRGIAEILSVEAAKDSPEVMGEIVEFNRAIMPAIDAALERADALLKLGRDPKGCVSSISNALGVYAVDIDAIMQKPGLSERTVSFLAKVSEISRSNSDYIRTAVQASQAAAQR